MYKLFYFLLGLFRSNAVAASFVVCIEDVPASFFPPFFRALFDACKRHTHQVSQQDVSGNYTLGTYLGLNFSAALGRLFGAVRPVLGERASI